MSALTDLQPYLDEYPAKLRKAKNASGFTLQELSDLSGVPYNNVCDTNAGRVKHPLLFYAAATCKVLNLSLNELVGLDEQPDTQYVHELELENVRLSGEVKHLQEMNAGMKKQVETHTRTIYMLIGVCSILLCAVVWYVIFDIQVETAGIFRSAGTSIFAGVLALILNASVATIIYAFKSIRKGKKK